jgi:hypothetical protein
VAKIERREFNAASADEGTEPFALVRAGHLKSVELELKTTGGPILISVELGTLGKSLYLTSGWVRVTGPLSAFHHLSKQWEGDEEVREDDEILVFWKNFTGSDSTVVVSWRIE